jgi:Mg2+ and Co2+ transporter CorA
MEYELYRLTDEARLEPYTVPSLMLPLPPDAGKVWLDVTNYTDAEIAGLLQPLQLPEAILKSVLQPDQSPKVKLFEGGLHIQYPSAFTWQQPRPPYLALVVVMLIYLYRTGWFK